MLHVHPAVFSGRPRVTLRAKPAAAVAAPVSKLGRCPLCSCSLNTTNIKRHLRVAHSLGTAAIEAITSPKAPVPMPSKAQSVANSSMRGYLNSKLDTPPEESRQPRGFADDGRDGSKHIGQFARDHGSFGSMPMHDDYGDEGDA
jgi:hypothetical protein